MQKSTVTQEDSLALPYAVNMVLSYNPAPDLKSCFHTKTCTLIFNEALHIVAKITKMPFKWGMDKQAGEHTYEGILFGHEEKWAHKPGKAMDEPKMYVSN